MLFCQSSNLYSLKNVLAHRISFNSKLAVNVNGKGLRHYVHAWKSDDMPSDGAGMHQTQACSARLPSPKPGLSTRITGVKLAWREEHLFLSGQIKRG